MSKIIWRVIREGLYRTHKNDIFAARKTRRKTITQPVPSKQTKWRLFQVYKKQYSLLPNTLLSMDRNDTKSFKMNKPVQRKYCKVLKHLYKHSNRYRSGGACFTLQHLLSGVYEKNPNVSRENNCYEIDRLVLCLIKTKRLKQKCEFIADQASSYRSSPSSRHENISYPKLALNASLIYYRSKQCPTQREVHTTNIITIASTPWLRRSDAA